MTKSYLSNSESLLGIWQLFFLWEHSFCRQTSFASKILKPFFYRSHTKYGQRYPSEFSNGHLKPAENSLLWCSRISAGNLEINKKIFGLFASFPATLFVCCRFLDHLTVWNSKIDWLLTQSLVHVYTWSCGQFKKPHCYSKSSSSHTCHRRTPSAAGLYLCLISSQKTNNSSLTVALGGVFNQKSCRPGFKELFRTTIFILGMLLDKKETFWLLLQFFAFGKVKWVDLAVDHFQSDLFSNETFGLHTLMRKLTF